MVALSVGLSDTRYNHANKCCVIISCRTPPVADHPAVQGAEGPEPVAPGLCDAVTGAAAAVPLPALSSVRDASTPLTARRTRRNACLQPPLWESLLLPAGLSSHAKDLMRALLEPLPDRRLGHNAEDFDRLMVCHDAVYALLGWNSMISALQ